MVVTMANNGIPSAVPPPQPMPLRPGNYIENGREYHGFHKGKYMYPCDEDEMDRMDIYHKFFSVARGGILHSTPFTPNYDPGPRILDLGTGTGIWAIDMADLYNAHRGEVHGVDLDWMQPQSIPPNLTFGQRDIESPWHGLDFDSWDLIHLRMLNGSINNWPDLYAKIFRHLKPGYGWMEHVEMDMIPRCDDNTLSPTSALVQWTDLLFEASQRATRPLAYNTNTRNMLEKQGFVEIQEQIIRVPLNPWPSSDPHLKEIGRWYNLGLTQGLQALSLGPLTRMMGWKAQDVENLIATVKREVCNKRIHVYCNMHIWIARRPADG